MLLTLFRRIASRRITKRLGPSLSAQKTWGVTVLPLRRNGYWCLGLCPLV